MKKILATLAVVAGLTVAFVDDAQARHRGGREVVRTRTVVRGGGGRSFSTSRSFNRSFHHNEFNSFRGFADPCYYNDVVVEEEVRTFRRSFR